MTQSKRKSTCITSLLLAFIAPSLAAARPDTGPVVPGVRDCTIEDARGNVYFLFCPPLLDCCVAPVYGACQPGTPPPGPCIIALPYTCCTGLEGCWYQRQGKSIIVWCGDPFPPSN